MPTSLNTNDQLVQFSKNLHNQYLIYRNKEVPFPPESVAFWCYLFSIQENYLIKGDLLELGVQHGGTAFLSLHAKRKTEKQFLVDLKRTEPFDEKWAQLTAHARKGVDFIESPTISNATVDLRSRKYRFIHIDAGHTYEAVREDILNYAPCIQDNGMICCDDFFINRWPDVTLAVLDTYQMVGLQPVALVNRKIYFAPKDSADYQRKIIKRHINALDYFGKVKVWEVTLRGKELDFYQISVLPQVSKDKLP